MFLLCSRIKIQYHFVLSLFRTFAVSYIRCFVFSLFRTFVVSYFPCFFVLYFRCFAVSHFRCFALSLFRTFVVSYFVVSLSRTFSLEEINPTLQVDFDSSDGVLRETDQYS